MDLTLPLLALPVIVAVFAALWLLQVRTRDATVVDLGWTWTIGLLAIYYAIAADGDPARRLVAGLAAGVWAARLGGHLLFDRVLGEREEDGRYRRLREAWGASANVRFFFFYQAQGLLALVLSAPFLVAASHPGPLEVLGISGALLVAAGLSLEALADRQLARWRADPSHHGKTCRAGLWRYSRHPNYFFEWVVWCGFGALGLVSPYGWVGLTAPAILLVLILYVTGIPPAEERAVESRGEDYRRYQRTTSPFVPWFPREKEA